MTINLETIGQHRPHEMTIKEGLKSPGHAATRKHKAYLTTDANPIGIIKLIDDTNTAQPVGKRAKTTASSSCVQFDRVAITRPTRRSAHAINMNSKKELFAHLSQEYAIIVKAYKELSETFNQGLNNK